MSRVTLRESYLYFLENYNIFSYKIMKHKHFDWIWRNPWVEQNRATQDAGLTVHEQDEAQQMVMLNQEKEEW